MERRWQPPPLFDCVCAWKMKFRRVGTSSGGWVLQIIMRSVAWIDRVCVCIFVCVCVRKIRVRLKFTELVTKTSFAWETFHSDLTDRLTHLSPKCRLALFYNHLNVDGASKCLNLHYFFFAAIRSYIVTHSLPAAAFPELYHGHLVDNWDNLPTGLWPDEYFWKEPARKEWLIVLTTFEDCF